MTAFWSALATGQGALAAQGAALAAGDREGLWATTATLHDAVAALASAWPTVATDREAQAALAAFHRSLQRHYRLLAARAAWQTALVSRIAPNATVW